jgi:hypothetical protein
MKRKAIAWLIPFLSLPHIHAQNSWEAKLLPGFLVPHHADMAEMMKHTAGIEIGRQWRIDSAGTAAIRQHHPLAGIGFTYDEERDAFIPPKKYNSWIFNEEKCIWEPPVAQPEDYGTGEPPKRYLWDEVTTSWVDVTPSQ